MFALHEQGWAPGVVVLDLSCDVRLAEWDAGALRLFVPILCLQEACQEEKVAAKKWVGADGWGWGAWFL